MKHRIAKKIATRIARDRCRAVRRRFLKRGYRVRSIVAALRILPDDLLERLIEVPHETRFWGVDHTVTPRYVPGRIGDGGRLCFFEPLNTRPDYYVLRIDSRRGVRDLDDEIYDAVANYYGDSDFHCETCDKSWSDDCPVCEPERQWPALDESSGSSWRCWPVELEDDK